jgi:hypothetical protein
MSERSPGDAAAIRYLLGRMPDEESRVLEQKLLQDREAFDEVMAAEDDLIDEYLEGGLSPDERRYFERAYLSAPDRRARVDFARALREKLGREKDFRTPVRVAPAVPPRKFAWMAVAAAVFAAIVVYLAIDAGRLRREVNRLQAEKAAAIRHDAEVAGQVSDLRERSARLERDLQGQRDDASRLADQLAALKAQGGRAVSFLLSGVLVRGGGEPQTLAVPGDAALVRLTLPITPGSGYASYRAVVQSPEGKSYWAGTGAWPAATAKTLTVTAPAASLPPGDYILSLTGVRPDGQREPAADFSFRVKKS